MLPLPLQMFHFWINTAFIDREYLCLHKAYIDGPDKDKHHKEFEADFKLEMFLDRVRALPSGCVRESACGCDGLLPSCSVHS